MRPDPLSFLSVELDSLKQQGLTVICACSTTSKSPRRRSITITVVNLSSNNYLGLTTHPAPAERHSMRFDVSASARIGADHRRHHGNSHGARAAAGDVQEDGGGGRLPERIYRQRRHGVVDSAQGRRRHFGRVESRQHHRRLPVEPRDIKVFPHKDVGAARQILRTLPASQRKLLITDGVFSMDGDLGPLPDLCALAEEFGCIMMVDDAHASGVFGRNGRGTIDHFEVHGRVDVQVGTLSKAIGALGGYVAGTRALIDYLHHRARPFLFSTSHPPAVAAACIAAIDVLLEEPQLIERLWENTRFFKAGLKNLGFNTGMSESPITPVIVGDAQRAMALSDRLFARGVFAQGIGFPTVARDKARVRTIVTATHTREQLQFALDAFAGVGRELGIIEG
jgi:glycine C-acetyltransferase